MKIQKIVTMLLVLSIPVLQYSKAKNKDAQEVNQNLQIIINKINALPKDFQPADIKHALKLMLQGKMIWNSIEQNKLYSALELKFNDPHTALILKNILEKSSDAFWIEIHNNQKIQQAIEQANVPFTREMASSPEYFMLFRMTSLKILINDDEILNKIKESYQQSVVALQWFLYAQMLLENESFVSAMITIPDKDLSLFYFLDGYAELISARYRLYSALSIHSFWQSDAHTQITRHWKHKKLFKDAAFGINFKNDDQKSEYLLPLNNSHLLFGTLDNKLTFIEWQKRGPHITDLIKTQKSLDPKLVRNDKISKDTMMQFKSLFGHSLTRHQMHTVYKDGISGMFQMLDNDAKTLFSNFLKKIKKYNGLDNAVRKGNEIILSPNKFKDFNKI